MKCYPIPQRNDWFITDRGPTICPHCGAKEVRKAVFGFPSREDFYNPNIYCVGCIPDFPCERDWGCRKCDAAFFKDTQYNLDNLNGIIRRKPELIEEEEKVYIRTEKEKADLMNKWIKEYVEDYKNLEIPF
mgnify:CR=1 FL=1